MGLLSSLVEMSGVPAWLLLVFLGTGLVLLVLGGDWLCRGAAGLALHFSVSPVVVGLTVVSAATSMPEFFTSLMGVLKGSSGLAFGNVVGSNAANLALILALTAIISPIAVHSRIVRFEVPILIAVSVVLTVLVLEGAGITRFGGIVLLVMMAAYLVFIVRTAKSPDAGVVEVDPEVERADTRLGPGLLLILAGTAALALGSDLLVDSAVETAVRMNVSETLIGLTLVAVGTSLPELAASLAAAMRGQSGIVVGNIVGSNLFNILLIVGLVGTLVPFPVAENLLRVELPGMILITLVGGYFIASRKEVTRLEGFVLLLLYAAFIAASSLNQGPGLPAG